MKSFEEIKNEISLLKSSMGSEFGSKYIDTSLPKNQMIVVRHLDTKKAIELLPIYKELYYALIKWIETNPIVQEYVFLPPLLEVGKDYFVRRFYVYYVSIRNYFDEEEDGYIEPPELFNKMRNAVSEKLSEVPGREGIIRQVLKKSLLEPTGKTIYEGRIMNKFIIVEPKISLEDLNKWKSLSVV